MNKKLTKIISLALVAFTLAGCSANLNPKSSDKENNKDENVVDVSSKQLSELESAIQTTLGHSFRYDKTFGTYGGTEPKEEVLPKGTTEEDIKEKVKGFPYFERTTEADGTIKLKKYYTEQYVQKLSNSLKEVSLRTKGTYMVYEKNNELYNENVYYSKQDTIPLMREYYSMGSTIKQSGNENISENGVKALRLPDENILTLSLLKVFSLKEIIEMGQKTSFLEEPKTDKNGNYYLMVRSVNSSMFANEAISRILTNKDKANKFVNELKRWGVDLSDTKSDNYKFLKMIDYPSRTVTVENALRSFIKYSANVDLFKDTNKLEEKIKTLGINTKLPFGDILKEIYENGKAPVDDTVKGLYLSMTEDANKNKVISVINIEKIYDNMIGDLEQYSLVYNQDDDFKKLIENKNSLISVKSFKGNFPSSLNAEQLLLTSPEFTEKLVKSIPLETLVQINYDNLSKINESVTKTAINSLDKRLLNGLDTVTSDMDLPGNKIIEWLNNIYVLNTTLPVKIVDNGEDGSNKDIYYRLLATPGKNKPSDLSIPLYDFTKYNTTISFKDFRGDSLENMKFKESNPLTKFKTQQVIDKVMEEAKNNGTVKESTGNDAVEGVNEEQAEKEKFRQTLIDSGAKEVKDLSHLKKLIEKDKARLLQEDDGFSQILDVAYGLKIGDIELPDANNKPMKITEGVDITKPTMVIYSSIDCPYCQELYKLLNTELPKLQKKFNVRIISGSEQSELADYLVWAKQLDDKGKTISKMFKNDTLFSARGLSHNLDISYKPTILYLDSEGVLVTVSGGSTDVESFNTTVNNALNTIDIYNKLK